LKQVAGGTTTIATIGYEAASVDDLLETLERSGVDLLIDVRAAARSRRPGFAKTRLATALTRAGIEYLHLPGLGTPPDGRAAARSGRHDQMRSIFLRHLGTPAAQESLQHVVDLLSAGRRACLLCLEAVPEHCHRSLVAEAIATRTRALVVHLDPLRPAPDGG
jgi:uncharacterized protein (DUF488 family)